MTRQHRHGVQPAAPPEAPPRNEAPASAAPPGRLSLGWRIALTVWAAGFAGLMLFELGAFLLRAFRGGK